MAYVKLSNTQAKNLNINLSNIFITEYMPSAPENYVKVYLTALSFALSVEDNDIDAIAIRLNLNANTVVEAFNYWQEQGIVHVADSNPPSVELLPIISKSRQVRKFSKEKYRTFNDQLHAIFPNRNILPNEYNMYYDVMEEHNIEIEAMLTVIGYCKRLKGDDINAPYIVTVARNLANEGCTTYDRVTEKISEFDFYSSELRAVFKALGLKKASDHDDRRLYLKWSKSFGFKSETIIAVAKTIKKGGMQRLDNSMTRYYENRLLSFTEITNYEANRDMMFELARTVNKIIGVYYEQLDSVIETYISSWINMGFSRDSITTIAEYCFKKGIRTLEGMHKTLTKFYQLGHVTIESISAFITEAVKTDEVIHEVIEVAGLTRDVGTRDRDYYRTWTYSWKMPHNVILYAAQLSKSAQNPISYLNSVLSNYHLNNVTTIEAAKKCSFTAPSAAAETAATNNIISCDFSSSELNAIFDKLNEEI